MISDVTNPRAKQKEPYRVYIQRLNAEPIIKKCDTMDEALKLIRENFRSDVWAAEIFNYKNMEKKK